MTTELDAFCAREHPRLVGALTLHRGDRWVAAELAQEALARVCADWSRVGRMQAPGAWVHRVAMNLCTSYCRRRTAERAARARYRARQVEDGAPEPAEALAVRRAVGALPVRPRTALVLRYYSDLTIEQTAAAMNIAPGTVKSSPTRPSRRCAPAPASPSADYSILGSVPVPDLSELLAQGAGRPVAPLDLPSVRARACQRRRRRQAGLAALVLVPWSSAAPAW